MSPELQRRVPLHEQIASHYRGDIAAGDFRPGDRLPSVRDIARECGVGTQLAARVIRQLKSEGLVRTGPDGTFVLGPQDRPGPEQRMGVARDPGERVEILAVERVKAPEYVAGFLALPDGWVLRREWVTFRGSPVPYMLSTSWVPAQYANAVPQLLDAWPLPDTGSAAHLIAARTGQVITGWSSQHESRRILDDGREGPLLHLRRDAHVLAEVCTWWAGSGVLEYREFVVPENMVVEVGIEP
jgi:DNA-binding GntR family transcriptional regulator